MKKWKRNWKIELIEKDNKNWEDLSIDWYDNILKDLTEFLLSQE